MVKSKKPNILFDAISKSNEKTKKNTNIYEYLVEKNEAQTNDFNLLEKSFIMRPWLTILLVNIVSLIVLTLIGYGMAVGIGAATPKIYGDYCNSTSDCSQTDFLVCSQNRCICTLTKYYTGSKCTDYLSYLSSCTGSDSIQCGYGLKCLYSSKSDSSVCDCSTDRYWNTNTNFCEKRYSYNETGCSADSHCVINKNLACVNSQCTCVYPKTWDGTQCVNIASFLEDCKIDLNCDSTKLLYCSLTGQYAFKCVCPYLYYWSTNSSICTSQSSYLGSCSNTYECRDDQNLNCNTLTKTCGCLTINYWNSTACERKKQFNEACTSAPQCDGTKGLTVCSTTCRCPTGYFYNGTSCQLYLLTGLNCASPFECDATKSLTCNLVLKQCVCPTYMFWNYATCESKRLNGSACAHIIQCRNDLGLVCDSTTKTCSCLYTHFWDVSQTPYSCMPKYGYTQSCVNTVTQCQDYNGLVCRSSPLQCLCPVDYYWNNTKCVSQVLFNEPCPAPFSSVMCMSSKFLSCNIATLKCRCSNPNYYWDSTTCVPKLQSGSTCQYQVTTNTNYQCDDSKGLICLATPYTTDAYTCQCDSTDWWTGSICQSKSTYKGSCTGSDIQCQDYNGLICYTNNTCLCPSTKYWNYTETICKDKLGVNSVCNYPPVGDNEMCQDFAWMYCLSNFRCGCNNERYYNGTMRACLPRASHDQYCGDGTLCMLPTALQSYPLTCLPEAGYTCQCNNYRNISNIYWSVGYQACLACPTNYLSGYGYNIQASENSITTRCYNPVRTLTARSGATCTPGFLMNIRNTMEMALASTWSSGSANFWVGATSNSATNFYWSNTSPNSILPILWCRNKPSGTCPVACSSVILNGHGGDCLDEDYGDTNFYICEFN